jgi:putative transposase
MMSKVFKVSRSAFYKSLHYLPSERDHENRILLFEIRRIHQQSKASYGSPRITDELKALGFRASEPRVERLLKRHKIYAIRKKRFVITTDSKQHFPIAENKLERNYTINGEGKVWVSNITYFRTVKGFCYLALIADLYSPEIIGYYISDSRELKECFRALQKAQTQSWIKDGTIHHFD